MALHLRLLYLALIATQWLFFPVYILILAQNGPLFLLLRV